MSKRKVKPRRRWRTTGDNPVNEWPRDDEHATRQFGRPPRGVLACTTCRITAKNARHRQPQLCPRCRGLLRWMGPKWRPEKGGRWTRL